MHESQSRKVLMEQVHQENSIHHISDDAVNFSFNEEQKKNQERGTRVLSENFNVIGESPAEEDVVTTSDEEEDVDDEDTDEGPRKGISESPDMIDTEEEYLIPRGLRRECES